MFDSKIETPLVSVLVPVYNVGEYVAECLESILAQTYKRMQIVVVDDGSTDRSGHICEQMAAKDSRVLVIRKKNEGLVAARQTGLQHATGVFVCNVDGDDRLLPTTIETLVKEAATTNADAVIAGHEEDLDGKRFHVSNRLPVGVYPREEIVRTVIPRMLNHSEFSQFGIFSYLWGKLFRRSLLLQHQMPVDREIAVGEDASVVYPAIAAAERITIIGNSGYIYRQRPSSMIKNSSVDESHRLQRLANYLTDAFRQTPHWKVLRPQILAYLLSLHVVRLPPLQGERTQSNLLWMFPELQDVRCVALFGAGTFGQQLYKRLSKDSYYSVVCWADFNWERYESFGLRIESPDRLFSVPNVPVAVCFLDSVDSGAAVIKMLELGLDSNRLHQLSIPPEAWESKLEKYGCIIPS